MPRYIEVDGVDSYGPDTNVDHRPVGSRATIVSLLRAREEVEHHIDDDWDRAWDRRADARRRAWEESGTFKTFEALVATPHHAKPEYEEP